MVIRTRDQSIPPSIVPSRFHRARQDNHQDTTVRRLKHLDHDHALWNILRLYFSLLCVVSYGS